MHVLCLVCPVQSSVLLAALGDKYSYHHYHYVEAER